MTLINLDGVELLEMISHANKPLFRIFVNEKPLLFLVLVGFSSFSGFSGCKHDDLQMDRLLIHWTVLVTVILHYHLNGSTGEI